MSKSSSLAILVLKKCFLKIKNLKAKTINETPPLLQKKEKTERGKIALIPAS